MSIVNESLTASRVRPLVSVIVPVYKAERYIHRCVDSILNQTYENLEIILVDDGSPDCCGKICDEYATKDCRIKVIHQENGGPSVSRNNGLKLCSGEYVAFVDSDDYILPDMYSEMIDTMNRERVDVCVCQWQYERADGMHVVSTDNIDPGLNGLMTFTEFAHFLYKGSYENGVVVSLWNKVYRKDRIKDVVLSGYYAEDDAFGDWLFSQEGHVYVLPQQLYIYVQNGESLTNAHFNERMLHFLKVLEKRCELFAGDEFILKETRCLYCNMYIEYYYKTQKAGIKMPPKDTFNKMVRLLKKSSSVTFKFLVRMYLFCCSPTMYSMLLVR